MFLPGNLKQKIVLLIVLVIIAISIIVYEGIINN